MVLTFDKSPALAMAFDILSMAIDRDKEKYVKRCEANRENGRKGGLAKSSNSKQSLPNGKRGLANLADKDMDKEKEMHKDNISTLCTEPEKSALNQSGILLSLNDKTFYDVPLEKIALWKETYPSVDVEQQLKRMEAWLDSNPTRRKTRRGIDRFINRWLSREQDEGGIYKNSGSRQQGRQLTPEDYELPPEYKEMYKGLGGKDYVPRPDDPFQ